MTRVLIAVDPAIYREGLRKILEAAGYAVAGAVASGEEAVQRAVETHPDVVILEASMPGESNRSRPPARIALFAVRPAQAHLERRGELGRVGRLAYLAGPDLDLPDIGRVATYAGIVRERAQRRRLLQSAKRIERRARSSKLEAPAIAEAAGRELEETRARRAQQQATGKPVLGLKTGLPRLDALLGGLHTGTSPPDRAARRRQDLARAPDRLERRPGSAGRLRHCTEQIALHAPAESPEQ